MSEIGQRDRAVGIPGGGISERRQTQAVGGNLPTVCTNIFGRFRGRKVEVTLRGQVIIIKTGDWVSYWLCIELEGWMLPYIGSER